jgi:hypothetical protein
MVALFEFIRFVSTFSAKGESLIGAQAVVKISKPKITKIDNK